MGSQNKKVEKTLPYKISEDFHS